MKGYKISVVISCIIFIVCSWYFINNDLWQDEIYTLTHFVFAPFATTLFDYHVANNHILFNFLLNIERHLLGMNDVKEAMLHPYYFRIIPFIISLVGMVFFYVAIKKLYGKKFALIALSVYVTTYSLLNFATQLRGYSLNIVLCTILFYYYLKCLKVHNIQTTNFLKLYLATLLSIICLPVNIYLIGAMIVLPLIVMFKPSIKIYVGNFFLSKIVLLKIVFSLVAGAALGTAFYVWLYSNQPPTDAALPFHFFATDNLIQSLAVFFHFTHCRIHFYLLLIAFLWMLIRSKNKKDLLSDSLVISVTIYVLYFIICFIHGAVIIQRFFLSLIPVFAVLIAAITDKVFSKEKDTIKLSIFFVLNFLFVIISFVTAIRVAKKNNEQSINTHDLINQYYLINFNPKQTVLLAEKLLNEKNIPLFLDEGFGSTGIADYLKVYKVPFAYFDANSINNNSAFIIISNNKKLTEKFLSEKGIFYTKEINSTYHFNIYCCNKN